ncbi:hypothetical protein L226DRAFT_611504 [Lentinus tigrinus ALCF2SS1-7]|uniref:uncharacterized protein n=1 Tax=Lentinus tigrinus ALCF2SS1-7 TaxID=1328758 RepID=UPI001166135D|nr:hypothetical protein L226DRAFT_611504 [Lentinus tigrinus ALCF2SS1-7]
MESLPSRAAPTALLDAGAAPSSSCLEYWAKYRVSSSLIPKPVLGGVTTFLFATVAVSGLRVISFAQFTRDRFVLAASLSFGLADILVPAGIFTHLFDGVDNQSSGLQGLFNSITIILSTPFLAAGIVASVLNIILTQEAEENEVDGDGSLEEEGSRQSEGKVEV